MFGKRIALYLAVFTAFMSLSTYAIESSNRSVSEKLIAKIEPYPSPFLIQGTFTVSPDHKKIAYAFKDKTTQKQFVVVNGKPEKKYDYIGVQNLTFSPDSQRIAYAVMNENRMFVVVDGEAGKGYDSIERSGPVFSPDSKRLAYGAKMGVRWSMVVDGEEGKLYDAFKAPIFSPDSKRVAYMARGGGKHFVVMDGVEGKRYDDLGSLTFSPDSERVAYAAKMDSKWLVIIDGEESAIPGVEGIVDGTLTFSPDSEHVAYAAKLVGSLDFTFAREPGTQRLSADFEKGNDWFVVLDGEVVHDYYSNINNRLIFSPDSKHLAYAAKMDEKWTMVVDGRAEGQYEAMGDAPPVFSPDSKRLAYPVKEGHKQFVVVDRRPGKKYDFIGRTLIFSPDSSQVVYTVDNVNRKMHIVVNGEEGELYDGIMKDSLIFSPDSKHLVCIAQMGREMFVVVDGKEGKGYDGIPKGGDVIFDSPDTFHYLAVRDGEIYLVEESIMSERKQEELTAEAPVEPIVALEKTIVRDDTPMILIPAGEFQMGSRDGDDNEKPFHTVYLDAFYMDKHEVTNAQYKKFVDATGHRAPSYWDNPNLNAPDHPVVGVSWQDAMAYCEWVGKRLPTEAEWEKAARGGLIGTIYPWNGSLTRENANYDGIGGEDKWRYTAPVGSFAPNGYGLFDMAGNVYEWCADWYDKRYYARSPERNPAGPVSGTDRIMRGGSWRNSTNGLRVAFRNDSNPASAAKDFCGCRCAKNATP